MRLEYYRHEGGNFGDDLNVWLWDALAPGLIDGQGDVLIGMGTLLGGWFIDRLPAEGLRLTLGAGGGKDPRAPVIDDRWRVYGVRGPLTCAYLDLDPSKGLTDPAMALRDLWTDRPARRVGVGFMPHYLSVGDWDWPGFCAELGLVYVDPHAPPEQTVRQIAGLERLLCEAMHGAIVADALRTPWVALKISKDNYTGKWDDWGASLGLPIYFKQIISLYRPDEPSQPAAGLPLLKRRLRRAAVELTGSEQPNSGRPRSNAWEIEECARLIGRELVSEPQLSSDARLDRALDRFHRGLDQLKADHAAGRVR